MILLCISKVVLAFDMFEVVLLQNRHKAIAYVNGILILIHFLLVNWNKNGIFLTQWLLSIILSLIFLAQRISFITFVTNIFDVSDFIRHFNLIRELQINCGNFKQMEKNSTHCQYQP